MSKRRAAELHVIEAARELRRFDVFSRDHIANSPYSVLYDALNDLDALPLDEPRSTFRNGTETGDEAGDLAGITAGSDAFKVMGEIVVGYAGSFTGATCDEIERSLGRTHQSVSARVHDLWRKGWIEDVGAKRLTRSRRKAIVWQPTVKGRKQFWEMPQ